MSRKILTALACAAFGLGALAIVPAAHADVANQASRIVFSQPVQIPGNTVLPAGTYWFKVDGTATPVDQNLVRIYNSDQSKLIATMETIPVTRTRRTNRGELVFAQQPKGSPVALLQWFYPDLNTGHQFVYSPAHQSQLMAETRLELYPKTVS